MQYYRRMDNGVMRIGLYGIEGVYNFGCEAIVRGAYQLIRRLEPTCEIVYFSYNHAYDARILEDLDIEIYRVKRDRNIIKRCINKGLAILRINKRIPIIKYNEIFEQVDVFFSIGGDIYTIPEVLRKNKKYTYYNGLVEFCNRAVKNGKKVIVYGASIGPFGEYQRAIDYYVKNLKCYEYIICRDWASIQYLKKLGVNKTLFFPDPAFQIHSYRNEGIEKKYIGINLSPLSLIELYGDCSEKNIRKLATIVEQIYDTFHIDIMFIPHVVACADNDNDWIFQKKICEYVREDIRDHLLFANYSQGFLGIKEQLKECHIVVSARMHCAINAIVESIPTIFLAYSRKSFGMCEYVYGSDNWVLKLENIESEIINRMQQMLDKEDEITNYLLKRNQEIQQYYGEHIAELTLG